MPQMQIALKRKAKTKCLNCVKASVEVYAFL